MDLVPKGADLANARQNVKKLGRLTAYPQGPVSGGMYVGGLHGGGKRSGEGDTVVDLPKVQGKKPWLVIEAVVVEFDHLYTPGSQRDDDILHFSGDHDEVAIDRCPAIANGLEVQGSVDAHSWRRDSAVNGDRLVSGEGEFVDAAVVVPGVPRTALMPVVSRSSGAGGFTGAGGGVPV
jgi:hypothetical protein